MSGALSVICYLSLIFSLRMQLSHMVMSSAAVTRAIGFSGHGDRNGR